ncbi:MAG: LysM family peptidoglycan binding protein [Caulobacter sp.]|nr:LysM family peptidoglycan binding protein [Caulobacter sp.]
MLPSQDRRPGPKALYQVSLSARRRWVDEATNLKDGKVYRPPTLDQVAADLNNIAPAAVGIGPKVVPAVGTFQLHEVGAGETLGGLAKRFYGDPARWTDIHAANRDKIVDPDRIYLGQVLRIPNASPPSA